LLHMKTETFLIIDLGGDSAASFIETNFFLDNRL